MTIAHLTRAVLEPLVAQNLSTYAIADRLGSSQGAIWKAMQRLGIKCAGKPGGGRGRQQTYQLSNEAKPLYYDPAEEKQWEPIGAWPESMKFTDAKVGREAVGRPEIAESSSGCGCAAAMAMEVA